MNKDYVENRCTISVTYLSWYDHGLALVVSQYKTFLTYFIASFGVLWGLVEATSFFFRQIELSNHFVLLACLTAATIIAFARSIFGYVERVPDGLEKESKGIQRIARRKAPFWEFRLAHALLKSRIDDVDQRIDDLLNNRVHIPIIKSMDILDYVRWIELRPSNLLRMLDTAKQLLVFDLLAVLQRNGNEELEIGRVVRVVNLIAELYRAALDFHTAGKEVQVPNGFNVLHEIQSEWVGVIQAGFRQTVDILESIASRDVGDSSPVKGTIIFESPPRIDEFLAEIEALKPRIAHLMLATD